MNKTILFSLLFSLLNTSLFGEGFSSETLVAMTLFGSDNCSDAVPPSLIQMSRVPVTCHAYGLNEQGKVVSGRISNKETKRQFTYFKLIVNDKEIDTDFDQIFYSPSRKAWVPLVNLDAGKDTVFSLTKGPLLIQDVRRVSTAFKNIKATLHHISVEKYANYLITDDYILVHNFAEPISLTLTALLIANWPQIVAVATVIFVKAYATEKALDFAMPQIDKLLNNPKMGLPNIPDTQPTQNTPPDTPPTDPENKGPGGKLSKIPPIVAAEEEIRKNGGAALQKVGEVVKNAKTTVQNALPGKPAGGISPSISQAAQATPVQQVTQILSKVPQSNINQLNTNDITHLIEGSAGNKHYWEKLVPSKNWADIKNFINKALEIGSEAPYKNSATAKIKTAIINGNTVEVTYNVCDGIVKIGSAWVR